MRRYPIKIWVLLAFRSKLFSNPHYEGPSCRIHEGWGMGMGRVFPDAWSTTPFSNNSLIKMLAKWQEVNPSFRGGNVPPWECLATSGYLNTLSFNTPKSLVLPWAKGPNWSLNMSLFTAASM